jgi:N-methylhydantoinase B
VGLVLDERPVMSSTTLIGPDDLGRDVRVHGALTAVAYVCPHCVTSLWAGTEPVAGKPWRDFAPRP